MKEGEAAVDDHRMTAAAAQREEDGNTSGGNGAATIDIAALWWGNAATTCTLRMCRLWPMPTSFSSINRRVDNLIQQAGTGEAASCVVKLRML